MMNQYTAAVLLVAVLLIIVARLQIHQYAEAQTTSSSKAVEEDISQEASPLLAHLHRKAVSRCKHQILVLWRRRQYDLMDPLIYVLQDRLVR